MKHKLEIMKRKILSLILFTFLLLGNNALYAQYKFRAMSPPGGFSYDGVKGIQQDSEGFIWILIENELYRYDGYEYKRHSRYFTEINSSKEWRFLEIAMGDNGKFYVNTNNGLFEYNRNQDRFSLIGKTNVSDIFLDPKNNLWVRENSKWSVLNAKTFESDSVRCEGKVPNYLGGINCSYNDNFYMLSNYGRVLRYNPLKNDLTLCARLPETDKKVLATYASKGKMWILTEPATLYKLDLTNFGVEEKQIIPGDFNTILKRAYLFDKFGNIWIGTINGLYVYNPNSKEMKHYSHAEGDEFSLMNNSVWAIGEDRQRNIWIGTYSGGVNYVNLDEKRSFKTYTPKPNSLNHAPVSAFAEDGDFIWIGTEGGGINRLSKSTGKFDYFTKEKNATGITSNNIKSLVVDKNRNMWIGTFSGGIDRVDLKSGQSQRMFNSNDNNNLKVDNIRKLVLEADSGLWIAYQREKIEFSYYDFNTMKLSHFDFSGGTNNGYIFDMLRAAGNQLWILTKKSIYRMDVRHRKLIDVKLMQGKFLNFNAFCLDDSGKLWIGTIGNGLLCYDPATSKLTQHLEILQHTISTIYNINYDNEGVLWMGTDNGLVSYNINSKELFHFNEYDGIQGRLFYPLATMRGLDGKLYFGGTNGFTIINPKELSKSNFKPRVVVSEFLIDYKPVKLNSYVRRNQTVVKLKYTQDNFGLKFSSDNYLNPQKVYFKYRLRGYDDRWIETDATNRAAFYSKIPAGTYYFEVLATNSDGVWSENPTILKIIRRPAPWASWPAYLLYFVILAFLFRYFWRDYQRKKNLELKLYRENVEKEKKEEIHQAQLTFFTNISHDFRTPLTLILASLERLRAEGLKEYYYQTLNNNARRLLNLVNELMDFRTVQSDKMKLELHTTDVNTLVKKLAADFSDFASQKNIQFNVITDESLPSNVCIDRNVVEKIVMNLLNNAFKYTNEGGEITIETHTSPYVSNIENSYTVMGEFIPKPFFSISVRDNGVGISKDTIATVFERFYKVKTNNLDSHLGTGVGLALVKSLVLLHRGTVTIYSERGKGTEMVVCLSSNSDIYDASNFAIDDNGISTALNENNVLENEAETAPKLKLEGDVPQKMKKKILFVEDNEELRQIIADYLSEDFDVIEAADGVEATKVLENRVIDLIISDIMMPRKDGITLCREVKTNVETSHIPIVLLTAKTSVESKLEGTDTGADLYFEKPIALELLKSNIQNIFRQRQQLKDYYAKNHFADSAELSANERDSEFIQEFVKVIDTNLTQPEMDVNFIASEMSMSRSKLYRKVKTMTDMSIIEFILSYKLKKAARLLIEEDMTMREIMDQIGIESQPYFTNAFKKEYGETPTAFAAKHKRVK